MRVEGKSPDRQPAVERAHQVDHSYQVDRSYHPYFGVALSPDLSKLQELAYKS